MIVFVLIMELLALAVDNHGLALFSLPSTPWRQKVVMMGGRPVDQPFDRQTGRPVTQNT